DKDTTFALFDSLFKHSIIFLHSYKNISDERACFLISLNNKKRKLKPADNLYSHFISFTSVLRTLAYFLALVKCRVTGLNTPLLSLRKPKTADLLFLSSKNMTSNFIVFLDKSLVRYNNLLF
ncbi:TPA: hypothetical protein ACL66P_001962, partial [Streptococcus pneumoniae]